MMRVSIMPRLDSSNSARRPLSPSDNYCVFRDSFDWNDELFFLDVPYPNRERGRALSAGGAETEGCYRGNLPVRLTSWQPSPPANQ